jgi:hypothetical protein
VSLQNLAGFPLSMSLPLPASDPTPWLPSNSGKNHCGLFLKSAYAFYTNGIQFLISM